MCASSNVVLNASGRRRCLLVLALSKLLADGILLFYCLFAPFASNNSTTKNININWHFELFGFRLSKSNAKCDLDPFILNEA